MSKRIPLTQGRVAIIDAADFDWLNQWKWCAHNRRGAYYAARGVWIHGQLRGIQMHRLILAAPVGIEVDHVNGDTLDNRRGNLRLCTHSQNHMNSRKRRNCSSKFKGVWWSKFHGRWTAGIRYDGRQHHLGYFDDEREAAATYDAQALKHFGAFAKLNLLTDSELS